MEFCKNIFDEWFEANKAEILEEFCEYLSINTASPNEYKAFGFLEKSFKALDFETWREEILEVAINNFEHCPYPMAKITTNESNFKAKTSNDDCKKILISCHIDVVPPCENGRSTFKPQIVKGQDNSETIYARGACDTKGNLMMLLIALRFLKNNQIPLAYSLEFDGVIEEEMGGVGALSTSLRKSQNNDVYGVIVLEPTGLEIYRGHRGCLGVTIRIIGESMHMGMEENISPIDVVSDVVCRLKELERRFNDIAKNGMGYEFVNKPVQINIGKICGGQWHGSSMSSCDLSVNIGFPHELNLKAVQKEITQLLHELEKEVNLKFELILDGIRNESYYDCENDEFYYTFKNYVDEVMFSKNKIGAWLVSCDARSYANKMNVPTIVFGCGELQFAHSANEHISMKELRDAAYILAKYLSDKPQ